MDRKRSTPRPTTASAPGVKTSAAGENAVQAASPREDLLAEFTPGLRGAAKLVATGAAAVKGYSSDLATNELDGLSPEQVTESMTEAMARAFHVCAWADAREERGMRFPPQTKIEEVAPETSAAAKAHAQEVAKEIVELNKLSLFDLAKKAMVADKGEADPAITEETAHELGWYMGMQSLGHGVSWTDDHEDFGLELPLTEFYPDFSPEDLRMQRRGGLTDTNYFKAATRGKLVFNQFSGEIYEPSILLADWKEREKPLRMFTDKLVNGTFSDIRLIGPEQRAEAEALAKKLKGKDTV